MSPPVLQESPFAQALRASPFPSLRKLSLEEGENTVTIRGQVSSYYLKQLAQETILPLLDGQQLCNRVQVVSETIPFNY
jgi:hypothetical protein